MQTVEKILSAFEKGITHLGENKAQEFVTKYALLSSKIHAQWHFIGHLQKNKVKAIIDKTVMIHSLDSLPLAEEIEKRAAQISRELPCFVQVNIASERTKHGVSVENLSSFLDDLRKMQFVRVVGLMCIPSYQDNPERVRSYFQKMREFKEQFRLQYLSMGMSHDFEIAIEEGATHLRVGEAIFGRR